MDNTCPIWFKESDENKEIDRKICKYGYLTTLEILELIKNNLELRENLSVAAHPIHGSHENSFKVSYWPGKLTREEIERVNFSYGNMDEMIKNMN